MKRIFEYTLPSLGGVLFILVLMGALMLGPRMMNIDGDLGRHLTIGGEILDTGRVPLKDIFSHTMFGLELTPHEWLSQVLFALFYRWMGLDGPVFLAALVIAMAVYLAYRQALERSQSVLAALFLGVLAVGASSLHWLTRPHVFTFLFLVLWSLGLERLRQGKTASLILDAVVDAGLGQPAWGLYQWIYALGIGGVRLSLGALDRSQIRDRLRFWIRTSFSPVRWDLGCLDLD
jgi:hypothetical protein